MKPPFQINHTPTIGVPLQISEGLRVITAPNASPMTFTGTQTYLLGETEIAVIDPGPDNPAHLASILAAGNGKISHIIVTHSHVDHSPLAARLAKVCGAPVYGFGPANAARSDLMETLAQTANLGGAEGIDLDFAPDILVRDRDIIKGAGWALEAIHTPGHLSNHLSFAWRGQDSLFSGDHVMGWASTLISPPDGDLTAFMTSLRRLQSRPEHTYFPGHGLPILEAHTMLNYLLAHRLGREDQIRARLESTPQTIDSLTKSMYSDVNPLLHGAAARNVLAHIIDLYERGLVAPDEVFSPDAIFRKT